MNMRHFMFFSETTMRQNTFSRCSLHCITHVLILCIYVIMCILTTDIASLYVEYCEVKATLCGFILCSIILDAVLCICGILRIAVLYTHGIIGFLSCDIIRIVGLCICGIVRISVLLLYNPLNVQQST